MKRRAWQSGTISFVALARTISCAAFSTCRPLASYRFRHHSYLCGKQRHDPSDAGTRKRIRISESTENTNAAPSPMISSHSFPIVLFLLTWFGAPQCLSPLDFYTHVNADDTSPYMLSTRLTCSTSDAREIWIENLKPRRALAADFDTLPIHQQPRRKQYTWESLYLSRGGRLMDLSSILDESTTKAILEEISAVERETNTELQVVIVDRIGYNVLANGGGSGELISERHFAKYMFKSWRIGRQANKKSGVLILVLLQQQRVEIILKGSNSYMTTPQWCIDLINRETVPMFKSERYSEGIYNAVVGVANRMREIDSGVASEGPPSIDDLFDSLGLGLLVVLPTFGIWALGWGIIYDRMYPMGEGYACSQCGGTKWNRVGTAWVKEPTYDTEGLKKIICKCSNCGLEDFTTRKVASFGHSEGDREILDEK